jgi:DNA-binding SARP family transcriptional activator
VARLSISLFGSFVVRFDDQILTEFSYDKVRALLAYLTVEAERPSRRERLAGLLWPDLPEAKGASNLRTALYDLRNAIRDREVAPPFLSITHSTLQLNPDVPIWSDVAAFRAQVAVSETTTAPDLRDPEYEEILTRTAHLYTGDFLHGFDVDSGPFDDWVLMQREALQLQALDVLERLIVLYQGRADHERVLMWARRQIALEPWREQAHRHAMRALAALGQRAAAVAQYERCCLVLREKLGLEPEPETRALLVQIRKGSLDLAPGSAGTPPQGHADHVLRTSSTSGGQRTPGAEVEDPEEQAQEGLGQPGQAQQELGHQELAQPELGQQGSGSRFAGLVVHPPWSPDRVERTVRDAEDLRRQFATNFGDRAAFAAAQASRDIGRAAGRAGAEALSHLYAGVVLANTTGAGFRESLSHFSRALALAQSEDMPEMTTAVLRYLGIDLPGEGVEGDGSPLIQAVTLYRDLGHRVGESHMLGVLAAACLDHGDLSGAKRYGEEGVLLARELGDRREEGALCRVRGIAELLQGQYGESMRCLQKAMTCFREVEQPAGEAATLRVMGALFDHLGAYDRAEQVLSRSMDILPESGSPADIMEAWLYLALTSLHAGDDAGAVGGAGKALSLLSALGDGSQRSGYPRLRAAALTIRGRVLAHQRRYDDAARAYREAMAIRQRGRWPGLSAEPRAGLAELTLGDEGPHTALSEIEGLLPYLEAGNLTGALDPLHVYLICYRVLDAADDVRSRQVLLRAHQMLSARAASIEDEGLQRAYLESVAVNREIAAAAAAA